MAFARKYNRPQFTYDNTQPRVFTKPSELVEQYGLDNVYTVQGLYINTESKYGNSPVIVTEKYRINAPSHSAKQIKEILMDDESIEVINSGKAGVKFIPYKNEHGDFLELEWVDL